MPVRLNFETLIRDKATRYIIVNNKMLLLYRIGHCSGLKSRLKFDQLIIAYHVLGTEIASNLLIREYYPFSSANLSAYETPESANRPARGFPS